MKKRSERLVIRPALGAVRTAPCRRAGAGAAAGGEGGAGAAPLLSRRALIDLSRKASPIGESEPIAVSNHLRELCPRQSPCANIMAEQRLLVHDAM